ncbi:MAG TPA: precorrin-3B C(17)-methyltransferase [Stellaceae bacterium]|jgi:cobalt-precorrin 5A hydrolase/precorrin-3B C17-methyltransferase|nr:precorrin-3B C(17)-methyltransferase [Stellaceae bacterium]
MSELPRGAAIVVLGPSALALARRLQAILPQATIHAPATRDLAADKHFANAAAHLRRLFAAGTPIIGLCASGILIRALAPLLSDKRDEPPVVAVAEDGSAIVPLLGGHHGANAVARAIAAATGGSAAITTAGDLRFDLALDAPPPGWRVANPERAKDVTAALLAGEDVALTVEIGNADWLGAGGARFTAGGAQAIRVTDRAPASGERALVLHPPVLALGVGCARGAAPDALRGLVDDMLAQHRLAAGAVALVASIDLKSDEDAVLSLAAQLGVPARFFTATELLAETPRLQSPSDAVFRAVGCYGVAEGAALVAAGSDSSLIVAKQIRGGATCALARAPQPLDAARIGRARGSLAIVGIGPGDASTRTAAADAALAAASDVVGYRLYLDLLGDALHGKTRHDGTLGEEETRARLALDLAAAGKAVALVSSGDAGIYGLATLVFELIENAERADWRRIALSVTPGISAMQAAAAKLGAPLGHDFCAISLSDLLTPWKMIERRLHAAAAGDFVIALYNPRSARRRDQLARACKIVLAARAADTPVALARNLGRDGERLVVTTLGALDPEQVDMLTLVLIGSSTTRRLADRPLLYTPRGYAAKHRP